MVNLCRGTFVAPDHRYYYFLDGLRGLAAFAVLLGHAMSFQFPEEGVPYFLAVDFFFMLSGFVITHVYGGRLGKNVSYRDYFIARLIRLFPLMALGATIGSLVTLLDNLIDYTAPWHLVGATAALNIAGLPSFIYPVWGYAFPFNLPAWSLFFELFASFALAIFIAQNTLKSTTLLAFLTTVFSSLLSRCFLPVTQILALTRILF